MPSLYKGDVCMRCANSNRRGCQGEPESAHAAVSTDVNILGAIYWAFSEPLLTPFDFLCGDNYYTVLEFNLNGEST